MRNLLNDKRTLIVTAAMTAIALPVSAWAHNWGGDWHNGWGWGWGHMVFGSIMMLVVWGGLILLIVLAVRWVGSGTIRRSDDEAPRNRALDVLEERFARGEIDKDEFEERRRLLTK